MNEREWEWNFTSHLSFYSAEMSIKLSESRTGDVWSFIYILSKSSYMVWQ